MADTIKVEVELDLSALGRYRQISEDDYEHTPVSITEAVVHEAARQIMEATKADVAKEVRELVRKEWAAAITATVSAELERAMLAPLQRTSEWGEPVGAPTSLKEVILAEMTRQLTVHDGRQGFGGSGKESTVVRVIKEQVNAALTKDLQAAFNTARDAMLKAAQDAGAAALRAAVTKAVG